MEARVPPPQQARSQDTLDRILRAARALIAEKGREAPSVTDIASRAGCSVGCFYGRFADKRSLFTYLDQQLFAESTACWRAFLAPERWERRGVRDLVRDTVVAMVDSFRQNTKILRALYMHWRTMPPGERVRSAAGEHYRAIFGWYADLLAARRDEIAHPRPETAAAFLIETLESILIERIVFAEDRFAPTTDTDASLKTELLNVALGYLGVENFLPGADAVLPPDQPIEETLV